MPARLVPVTRRLGRLVAGLAAVAVLAALLVGAPMALLAFAGNPLPDHLPTLSEITGALTRPDDGQLFLRTLAVLGWAGWATFALSVLVEIPARLLRLPAPRLPGMATQQRVAGALVAAAMLLITAGAPATAAASAARSPGAAATAGPATGQPAPGIGQPAAVRPGAGMGQRAGMGLGAAVGEGAWVGQGAGGAGAGLVPGQRVGPPAQPDRISAAETRADGATSGPVYRVRRGDYLGHVAARYLGDFDRYRELAKRNKLRNPDRILPGQRIELPAEARDAGKREHATGAARTAPQDPPAGRLPASADRDIPSGPFDPEVAGGPFDPGVALGPLDSEIPSGPFDPESFAPSPTVAAALDTSGRGASDQPANQDTRGRLALAVAAVVAAAGAIGAHIAVLLGRRRPPKH